jgi:hypothetical protein
MAGPIPYIFLYENICKQTNIYIFRGARAGRGRLYDNIRKQRNIYTFRCSRTKRGR